MRRSTFAPAVVLIAAASLVGAGCHDAAHSTSTVSSAPSTKTSTTASATTTTSTTPIGPAIVFNAQASRLDAYATTAPFLTQTVVPSPTANKNGVAVSGQICFDPTDARRFVAVDRTAVDDGQVGWGVFELSGDTLGKLSAKETARLVPTYQPAHDAPTPFGCGFLPDGRLLTTDLGNQSSGADNGQLIEWFPPFDQDTVGSCKIDVGLAAPEGVLVDGADVLVAESRGRGVTNFVAVSLPTAIQTKDLCADRDSTGATMATGVSQSPFLKGQTAHALAEPAAVVAARNGDFYVADPRTGVIAEVDGDGQLVRRVLVPPSGEKLGARPFTTGTPMGLGVEPDGTLDYADPGLVVRGDALVAGLRTGTIRRIAFVAGRAQPPEVVASGLEAPEGIGIWMPPAS